MSITVNQLIRMHEMYYPDSAFFRKSRLKFFGERISDMRILKNTINIDGQECYVLSTLQRNAPSGKERRHFYFDVKTYEYSGYEEL